MSCVAELNAKSQNTASVPWKKNGTGIKKATPASPAPISSCMVIIHHLLVLIKSTNGLQNGLMTHGRYSQLV